MFDPSTSALIASSPPLDGLNADELPKRLTDAFADIVAARIRLRGQLAEASDELKGTLSEVRRLAAAHEAFVALLPERDNRRAAAFVAASAHQVCLLGQDGQPNASMESFIDAASIAPEVCATLLFLVAEAHADAAEAAKRITPGETATAGEKALLLAIKFLAFGRLAAVRALAVPVVSTDMNVAERAVEALRVELLKGVKALASRLTSRVDLASDLGEIVPATTYFERVKALSVSRLDELSDEGDPVFSVFPGPLHLANLLISVERDLIESALSRIPTPQGLGEDNWWQIVRRMARNRPFLWRNHREAIDQQYLEKGVSSAISFPTGGGKSTLAELKIATALLRGEKVVFLVPTHALVDQTTKALKATFNTFDIVGDAEDDLTLADVIVLPEVIVTTPERCLMLISVQPEAFADLGLVVFDECHLLHPRDAERSRRSVDAMLAILNLTLLAPNADLLFLSAMMKNAEELAEWTTQLTGRVCLALNLAWKPTRQVRGSVVYAAAEIGQLNDRLRQSRRVHPTHVNPPVAVRREMKAKPFGFFSLLQTWATQDRDDYTLLPLLPEAHSLSTGRAKGGSWYLTPNGNQTSAVLAAAAAAAKLKTLVFVQTTVWAESSVKDFRQKQNAPPILLTEAEQDLHRLASEELGGTEYCYLQLEDNGTYAGGAASHHSMLLREERQLHESLFKRPDGISVLFATSTLAQGMNLPSQLVIIAGDSRFDPTVDKMAQLEAHELLNAAGRAGRAGEASQGMVLVVPSRVVEFDAHSNLINAHWLTLQAIFSQSDQCLVIDDPLTILLDKIHEGVANSGMPAYFLSRVPPAADDGGDAPIRALLGRSFAAFRARKRNDEAWVETRIAAAFEARKQLEPEADKQWLERVAGLTGVSVKLLGEISAVFAKPEAYATSLDAIEHLIAWMESKPEYLLDLLRPENVEGLFGGVYAALTNDRAKGEMALPIIRDMLNLWMSGGPLNEVEQAYPGGGDAKHCEYSRHFMLRLVPDLAFVASLPARILTAQAAKDGAEPKIPTVLATLGAVVREGCDSAECLAVKRNAGASVSRVAARGRYETLIPYLNAGDPFETFEDTRDRIRGIEALVSFLDHDDD
jgi:superfamily II DNA/RNA helicase